MASLLHHHVGDQVATITFDSPANRNALSRTLTGVLTSSLTRRNPCGSWGTAPARPG